MIFRAEKYFRRLFCIIIFLSAASKVFSQDADNGIKTLFETYSANNYQEKVFLHVDKSVYATGEILWFKCYVTDAVSNNLSALSKVCYVEVIGNDKKQLLQGKIAIDSGTGNGSFIIPSSIRTGNYIIRAYTNWMKNFDAGFYFEQPVSIINPDKKPEAIRMDSAEYSIQFFPEGGNLVYGLNSTVAFKITDGYGKGLDAKGIIANENNDTVANFETQKFGMGTFRFKPESGNEYYSIVRINGKRIIQNLPEIYSRGWTMHLEDEGNSLRLHITTNEETAHGVYLFVQTKGKIKLGRTEYLKNGSADFIIYKSDLDEGISQLTVFNENKQPVCERLYFKKPAQYLQIKLNGPAELQKRKKASIDILTSTPNGDVVNADLSVSVYLLDSLQPAQEINILNYLWLSSDIKGAIESPQYYFENAGVEVDKATDNLMLTQGWRRFKWEDVLKDAKPSFSFLPEREGLIVTGKILPSGTSSADATVPVYLSVPGNNFKFSLTNSSTSGALRFNVEKFYGRHEIIGMVDSTYRMFIDNPFSDKFSYNTIAPINLKPALKNEILTRSIGAQADNIYQPDKKDNFILPVTYDTTRFFGYPSKTYYLDDYTRFHSMEEVMREYVKEVHVRNRQNTFHYEVYNELEKLYFNEDPLVLIDGLPVFDINRIMEIDPLKIKKIDITTTRVFLGKKEYDGIVSYSTYNGDLEGYELTRGALVLEYDGVQPEREFYSPQYEIASQSSSRLPDFRNVLYWSPHVKTINGKSNMSFFTSDVPGKYVAIVQGVSEDGLVGSMIVKFVVSK
jgi:hypothetical protein